MKPIHWDKVNVVYAENQPAYIPLPVYKRDETYGLVTSCWNLSWRERLIVFITGQMFFTQMTFNDPLQPIKPEVEFNVD